MARWGVRCKDLALVFARAEDSALSTTERSGAAAQIEVDLKFTATGDAKGEAVRRTLNENGFTRVFSSGLFQQGGTCEGTARVGKHQLSLKGAAVRARAWGVPEAQSYEWRIVSGDRAGLREFRSGNDLTSEIGDPSGAADQILATVEPAPGLGLSLARFGDLHGVIEARG
jgi:hypothetical protein